MFLDKITEDDFFSNVENNLNKLQKADEARQHTYKENILKHLKAAANILHKKDFEIEADIVNKVCEYVDPATKGLNDPKKMLENLERHGIPLNVLENDDQVIIDLDTESE